MASFPEAAKQPKTLRLPPLYTALLTRATYVLFVLPISSFVELRAGIDVIRKY